MQFPTISGVKQCYVTGPRGFSLFHLAWFGHTMKNLREWIIRIELPLADGLWTLSQVSGHCY